MEPLPYLTASLPGVGGALRDTPEDFCVDELPAYLPTGDGEHVYIRFEKRGLTTPAAVDAIARALDVSPREAGWAGLKDRHAVTSQWASFARADVSRAEGLSIPNVRVLEVSRHRNKLRTGHLRGNRFTLRLTGIVDETLAVARCKAVGAVLSVRGVPNYYGEQRFGREGDNAVRGTAWLRGEAPAPRDSFLRKLWVSAVQSELFNRYLAARVVRDELDTYVDGDLATRMPAGRPWAIDPAEATELYASRDVSATGPMFGSRMPWPLGTAGERERTVLERSSLTLEHFARARDLGEGARRTVRIFPEELTITAETGALRLAFTLPAGAYATVVLREFQKLAEDGLQPGSFNSIQPMDSGASSSDPC